MKLRFALDRKTMARNLRRRGRKEWRTVGVLFLILAVLVFCVGPLDTLFMGEPYEVEGELQDCYILRYKAGKAGRRSTLRIVVDDTEYTVWKSNMGMNQGDFQKTMISHAGENVHMQCVDSPAYQRIVADLLIGDTQYIRLEDALENRRENDRGLIWMTLIFAAAGMVSLVYAFGIVHIRKKKKRRRRKPD